jgi:hypothetical protein
VLEKRSNVSELLSLVSIKRLGGTYHHYYGSGTLVDLFILVSML